MKLRRRKYRRSLQYDLAIACWAYSE